MTVLQSIIENERINAVIAWPITCSIGVAAVATVHQGSFLWTLLAMTIVVLALAPTIIRRDPLTMPPWEVLAIAAIPIGVRLYGSLGCLALLPSQIRGRLCVLPSMRVTVYWATSQAVWP